MRRSLFGSTVVWLIVFLCSCSALPEVGPFVDATITLRAAVDSTGTAVQSELQTMQELWKPPRKYDIEFGTEWKARVDAANALVAYANSLRAIVDAGNAGGDSIGKLIDSTKGLASAAGIAVPAGSVAVEAAGDIAKFIYKQVAIMRAAESLEEALVRSQPAVSEIGAKLAEDLNDADVILQVAAAEVREQVEEQFEDEYSYRNALLRERQGFLAGYKGEEEETAEAQAEREATMLTRIGEIDKLLGSMKAWHDPLEARLAANQARLKTGRALIAATKQGIVSWIAAHEQLTAAVKDRRPVNPQLLIEAAVEIRTLVRKVRDQ